MKDLEKQAEDFIKDYPSYVIQKQFDLEDPVIYKLLSDFANEVSKALLEEAAEDIKKFRNEVEFPRTSYDDKVYYQSGMNKAIEILKSIKNK